MPPHTSPGTSLSKADHLPELGLALPLYRNPSLKLVNIFSSVRYWERIIFLSKAVDDELGATSYDFQAGFVEINGN